MEPRRPSLLEAEWQQRGENLAGVQPNRSLSSPEEQAQRQMNRRALTEIASKAGSGLLRGLEFTGEVIDNTLGLPGYATGALLSGRGQNVVPRGFSEQVGEAVGQSTGNEALGMTAGLVAGIASPGGLPSKGSKAVRVASQLAKKVPDELKGLADFAKKFKGVDGFKFELPSWNSPSALSREVRAANLNRLPRLEGDETITVYRGVPDGVKSIRPGDWVTSTKANNYSPNVIEMKVKRSDLLNQGVAEGELIYAPKRLEMSPEDFFAPQIPEPNDTVQKLIKQFNVPANKLDEINSAIYVKAPEAKGHIENIAREITELVPNTRASATSVKGIERSIEKVFKEEAGNVDSIKDFARNTITPMDRQAQASVIRAMDARPDVLRKKVQSPEDYMGYEGVIYNVRAPNGLVTEVQVVSPKMIYGKMEPEVAKSILGEDLFEMIRRQTGVEPGLGHKLYESLRSMSDKAKNSKRGQDLLRQSIDYYEKLQ